MVVEGGRKKRAWESRAVGAMTRRSAARFFVHSETPAELGIRLHVVI